MPGGEEDPIKALVDALTKALKDTHQHPSATLRHPTFDWNSTEKYEDFQIFIESTNSWFKLQNTLAENPDGTDDTRLEYVLSFLGATGRKKHKSWNPDGKEETEEQCKGVHGLPPLNDGP